MHRRFCSIVPTEMRTHSGSLYSAMARTMIALVEHLLEDRVAVADFHEHEVRVARNEFEAHPGELAPGDTRGLRR